MKNKERNRKINLGNVKIKVIGLNDIHHKDEKYNQDIIYETNFNINNDKIYSKYNNNTITYNNTEKKLNILYERNNNILYDSNNNNIELLSQDKFIQTSPNFYSYYNLQKFGNKCLTPRKRIKDINKYNFIKYRNYEINKNIPRIFSGLKQNYISKPFYNKFQKIRSIKHSRNQTNPLIKNKKQKTKQIESYFDNINILKEYFNKKYKEKKKKHHNLLTIENIYFQNRNLKTLYQANSNEEPFHIKNKKNKFIHNKCSIKEIKYPLNESENKKINIINDNNANLLEKIFKKQTLSNFNNKYTLKYKTNNKAKKENIKILFSLLKKYKYSDEDKQFAFNKYNSMKKIKKFSKI